MSHHTNQLMVADMVQDSCMVAACYTEPLALPDIHAWFVVSLLRVDQRDFAYYLYIKNLLTLFFYRINKQKFCKNFSSL